MRTTLEELKFTNPFSDTKLYPFYVLVEVASNREGPENYDRLINLLGESESLILDGVVS